MELEESSVVDEKMIKEDLTSICKDLEELGYEPIKLLVAYLISGDPGYITGLKECRDRLLKYKREDIIETLLVNFIN